MSVYKPRYKIIPNKITVTHRIMVHRMMTFFFIHVWKEGFGFHESTSRPIRTSVNEPNIACMKIRIDRVLRK